MVRSSKITLILTVTAFLLISCSALLATATLLIEDILLPQVATPTTF